MSTTQDPGRLQSRRKDSAQEYAEIASIALLVVAAIPALPAALLAYVGWRYTQHHTGDAPIGKALWWSACAVVLVGGPIAWMTVNGITFENALRTYINANAGFVREYFDVSSISPEQRNMMTYIVRWIGYIPSYISNAGLLALPISFMLAAGLAIHDYTRGLEATAKRESREEELARRGRNVTVIKITVNGKNHNITTNPIIAEQIKNSFNTLDRSRIDGRTKRVVDKLVRQINDVGASGRVSDDEADALGRDSEQFVQEAAANSPREKRLRDLLGDISVTAEEIGSVGKPIIETISELSSMLGGLTR